MPITLSVVPENDQSPKLISPLIPSASKKNQFLRATASPFLEAATRDRLASLDRRTLILAGFFTEVVVLHAALHALQQAMA